MEEGRGGRRGGCFRFGAYLNRRREQPVSTAAAAAGADEEIDEMERV